MSNTQGDQTPLRYRKLDLAGYNLPVSPPLSGDDEYALGITIQSGNAALSLLVESFVPTLEAALASADTSPFDRGTLFGPALAGARQAVETHALSDATTGDFVGCAASMIQQAVAEYIDGNSRRRWDCGGDGTNWASNRLTRRIFEEHVGESLALDPALLRSLRSRGAAIETLVSAHSRLLASMLAANQGRGSNDTDLLQRGWIALRRAAASFDPDRHPRFNALARTAIANDFENARRDHSGVTANGCRLIGEFNREELRLAERSGGLPTERKVFESLGWSRTKRENYSKARAATASATPLQVHHSMQQNANPLQELINREEARRFDAAWGALDELAQEILVARFLAEMRETHAELVARLEISLHRVRTIEEESLDYLRRRLEVDQN